MAGERKRTRGRGGVRTSVVYKTPRLVSGGEYQGEYRKMSEDRHFSSAVLEDATGRDW